MAAVLMIDHRLTFLLLVALLIAGGIPLAIAWARVLPEEAPPFPIEPGSFPSIDEALPPEGFGTPKRERLAISLLALVTLAYLIRFPGFPKDVIVRWLDGTVASATAHWIIFASRVVLIAAVVAAAVYAGFHRGPLRVPLAVSATLVLIVWFLTPVLRAALLSGP